MSPPLMAPRPGRHTSEGWPQPQTPGRQGWPMPCPEQKRVESGCGERGSEEAALGLGLGSEAPRCALAPGVNRLSYFLH